MTEGPALIDHWLRIGEQRWLDLASTWLTWAHTGIDDLHGARGRPFAAFPIDRYALWMPSDARLGAITYTCRVCSKRMDLHSTRTRLFCGCRHCGGLSRAYDGHELRHLNVVLESWKAFVPNRDRGTALVLGDALSLASAQLAGLLLPE